MSGHSKWENIKRAKGVQDQKRGKVFGKLTRFIVASITEGGSADPSFNPRLRMAIDRAKAENMPKDNINRAIASANKSAESFEELMLEGYGPDGIAIMINALTDNRQRTIQEIKSIFHSNSGSLAEPGAVAFQFESKGMIVVKNPNDEEKILEIIDSGAEDFEEEKDLVVVWTSASEVSKIKNSLKKLGFKVKRFDLIMQPKSPVKISGKKVERVMRFLETLEDHDDVQKVFFNVEF